MIRCLTLVVSLIVLSPHVEAAATSGTASLSGSVSSLETGNMLQGAIVELPTLNRQAITDNGGRFNLSGLPAGPVEIIVTYTGLKEERRKIVVGTDGQRPLTFELAPSEIITLSKFTVASEREGNALAVTSQRNAPNIKNTIAMDAFGNMPNMGVGELMMRLPGTAPVYDPEGNVGSVSVRGMPSAMTSTTIDGTPAFRGNGARGISYVGLTGAIFEQVELTKGHTPDQTANSLGGSVNLKTRSPLSMKERRRITYNLGARWAPPFYTHSNERRRHAIHPLLNLSYQEAMDAFGGEKNFGVSVSLFYSENVNAGSLEAYNYQNTLTSPAYIYDYRSISQMANRHITTANVKLEYRPTPGSKIFFGAIYNQGDEPAIDRSQMRFFTAQSVATLGPDGQPTGTGAILPGYTNNRTQVRPLPASQLEFTNSHSSFIAKSPTVSGGAELKLERWDFDLKIAHTSMHIDRGVGKKGDGGTLVMRASDIGWIVDRTKPDNPQLTQTAGRSIYDVSSYTFLQHTIRDEIEQSWAFTSELNGAYRMNTQTPVTIKSGLFFERRMNDRTAQGNAQWNRVAGAPPLPNTPLFQTLFDERQGGRLPIVDARVTRAQLSTPSLWTEDLNYREVQKLSQTKYATEDVTAAYTMGRAKIDRLGILAGVRVERTEVTGRGNIRRRPATVAEIPDPVARARYDWGIRVKNKGSYTRSFPSVHFTYDLIPNLKARASWSTSFGRPAFSDLVPNATISDTAQTVTIANPGLGPQYSKNIDVGLEYFFVPAGLLTVGYFEKDISDYILTSESGVVGAGADNGYGGDYSGYRIYSRTNAGTAQVKGWEVDYRQQFPFLPGFLKGIELAANYTTLKTEGDFGGTSVMRNTEVAGFVPRTANVSLAYNYSRFGMRFTYNYASDYLRTFNATPALRFYTKKLETAIIGLTYRWRPGTTFSIDLSNAFAAQREAYQLVSSRTAEIYVPNQMISFGVSGHF
jgi:TonB-dependent receptor